MILTQYYIDQNVEGWADQMRKQGEVLPPDREALRTLFYLQALKDHDVPYDQRVQIRDHLVTNGHVDNYPISVIERILARGELDTNANHLTLAEIAKMDVEQDIVLICNTYGLADRILVKMSSLIKGQLDTKLTSVINREIWTLQGKRIVIVVNDTDFELPRESIIFKEVMSVFS